MSHTPSTEGEEVKQDDVVAVRLGALAPDIRHQPIGKILGRLTADHFQRYANSVVSLRVAGIMTDREADRAFKRIAAAMAKVANSTFRAAADTTPNPNPNTD